MSEAKKIILLEDDKASARLLSTFLQKRGYEVLESYEGRFAIEMALKERPDLLIADVLLPDMHGSEAVKQIKSSAAGDNVQVLFLTSLLGKKGNAGEETQLTIGSDQFPALAKPFKPDVLASIVERMVGGAN